MAKIACLTVTHESAHAVAAFAEGVGRLRAELAAASEAGRHDLQVIVVDNASTDGTAAALRARGLEVLALEENAGWSAGNNRAFDRAAPDATHVLLLNPDIQIGADALHALLAALDAWPGAGAAVPDIRLGGEVRAGALPDYGALDARLGHFGWRRAKVRRLRGRLRSGRTSALEGAYGEGGCLLLTRAAADAVFPLDERYFVFFDDVDLGRRLCVAGYRTLHVPAARVDEVPGKGSRAAPGKEPGEERLARYALYLDAELRYYARWWGPVFARRVARQRDHIDLPLLEGRWRRRYGIVGVRARGREVVRRFLAELAAGGRDGG